MKGIHLNDIPINLFMEYFNKTNLTPTVFTPKYITPVIYEYEFEMNNVVGTSYYYRSTFDFVDIYDELDTYFSGSSIYALIDDPVFTGSLFYDSTLNFVTGHHYRFTSDIVTWENFIKLSEILSKTDETIFTMTGNKDQTVLFDTVDPLTANWDPSYQRWNIKNNVPTAIGYIYENTLFQIQDTDAEGNLIFLDEYDRETIEYDRETINYSLEDQFSRHNASIREVYNKINTVNEQIGITQFNPEVLGILDSGIARNKSLVYYEEYTRTKTYTRLTTVATGTLDPVHPTVNAVVYTHYIDTDDGSLWTSDGVDTWTDTTGTPTEYQYIDRSRSILPVIGTPIVVVETPNYPIQTVLNLDNLRKLRVLENTGINKWVQLNVIAQDTAPTNSDTDDYWIDTTTDTDILRQYDGDWTSIALTRTVSTTAPTSSTDAYWIDDDNNLYQYKNVSYTAIDNINLSDTRETILLDTHFRSMYVIDRTLLIPLDIFDGYYYFEVVEYNFRKYLKMKIDSVAVNSITIGDIEYDEYTFKNTKSTINEYENPVFVINGMAYTINVTTDGTYTAGSFLIPTNFDYTHDKTIFGDSININQQSVFILEKYDAPVLSSFDALDIEKAETTTILKDIFDNSMYVEYKESYIKTVVTEIAPEPQFTEFLDYEHNVTTGTQLNLKSNSTIYRASAITEPVTIEDLIANFNYSHYFMMGYPTEDITGIRGNLIAENVIYDQRMRAIKELSAVFMEKRYDDFLFYDSDMLFSDNALTNMRIFSEGYLKGLEKDNSLFELPEATKDLITYDLLSPRIIVGDIQVESSTINTKIYTQSMPYILENLATENIFTKLLDYERFPSDLSRKVHLADQSKRLKAYNDFTKITAALDIPEVLVRTYKRNVPTKLDFKNFLIYNLFQNFYKYNAYDTDGNSFTKNYEVFYKEKLNDTTKSYMPTLDTTIAEKTIYRKEDMTIDNLLEKILIDEWSVL